MVALPGWTSGQHPVIEPAETTTITTGRVGKDGAVIIPAELRRRFGLVHGASIVAEAHPDGVLVRVATADTTRSTDHDLVLEETNRAYALLRADPQAWKDELAKRRLWETTLADGLETSPGPTTEGTVQRRANPTAAPRRGEIWLVELDPTRGREQAGRRPVLVASANADNA